ncbi:hypothetical protein OUZ56_003611 [Daphnia magna]|uniref:Transposable element P transposase-like GTP-binding insertion domain-containing protein n=1 Tax=Daphnia magna TaxID=35525 RepID=A0ABR0A976_9CRUS|nr:hypothetical protein OUZ56_003611 [Daphnia magna]
MKNLITHSTSGSDVFFLRNVPHLFKCIRNHIFNHKVVQAAGRTIKYLDLFLHDEIRGSTGLSLVSKLKPVHVNPNSFQRMSVKLAVQNNFQMLSNFVTDGLRHYRMAEDVALA